MLIACIYEVFPLLCPLCGGQMRLIAFITHSADIRQILDHIGVESEPPHISPARGPPLWEDCDAQMDDGVHIAPDWDLAAQPAPDYEVDQRRQAQPAILNRCGMALRPVHAARRKSLCGTPNPCGEPGRWGGKSRVSAEFSGAILGPMWLKRLSADLWVGKYILGAWFNIASATTVLSSVPATKAALHQGSEELKLRLK